MPFIARYRKEMTGALDDSQLRTLNDRLRNKPGTPLAPARLIRRIARPPSIIDGTWTVPAVKKAA